MNFFTMTLLAYHKIWGSVMDSVISKYSRKNGPFKFVLFTCCIEFSSQLKTNLKHEL